MSDPTSEAATAHPYQIVIVGGGAGGLGLTTALGDKRGRRGLAAVILIDKSRTHVWKPKLRTARSKWLIGMHGRERNAFVLVVSPTLRTSSGHAESAVRSYTEQRLQPASARGRTPHPVHSPP